MSTANLHRLDRIVERGDVSMIDATYESALGFMSDRSRNLIMGDMRLRLTAESIGDQIHVELGSVAGDLDADDAADLSVLLDIAAQLLRQYDAEMEAERAERRERQTRERREYQERQKREREEQARQREAKDALVAERTERLLMEFVGDEVRVRHHGYKTMARAIVKALEQTRFDIDSGERVETGEYRVRFVWCVPHMDSNRPQSIDTLRRIDVRDGSRFYTIWDDGNDDLNPWDRDGVAPSKPWTARKFS